MNGAKVRVYSKAKDGNKKLTANFSVKEFACKDGSDPIFISHTLVEVLQQIRDHFDAPIDINSAYRTVTYNKKVGGAAQSQHLYGMAADFIVRGVDHASVATYAEYLLHHYGGVGRYSTFTHIDVRATKTRWNG